MLNLRLHYDIVSKISSYNLPSQKRFELMVNIINQSQADLIVFCGHTLKDKNDLCVDNQGKMEKRRELLSAITDIIYL